MPSAPVEFDRTCISYTAGNSSFRSRVTTCIEDVRHDGEALFIDVSVENEELTDPPFYPDPDIRVTLDGEEVARDHDQLYQNFTVEVPDVESGTHELCIEVANKDEHSA